MKGDTREQRPTTTTTSEAIDEAASLEQDVLCHSIRHSRVLQEVVIC